MSSSPITANTIFIAALVSLTFFSFFTNPTLSADSPSPPPSVSPSSPSPLPPPSIPPVSSPPPAMAPSTTTFNSPPAPPPSDPEPPTSPSPDEDSPSPFPAPVGDNGTHVADSNAAGDGGGNSSSSRGLNAGQKAGVAIAVIAGACLVGGVALVYKKRRQNMQRAQFGNAARREFL